jgi:hypothetical protein
MFRGITWLPNLSSFRIRWWQQEEASVISQGFCRESDTSRGKKQADQQQPDKQKIL